MSGRFQHLEFRAAQAVSLESTSAVSLLSRACAAELQGRFEPALQSYSAALRGDASLDEAWAGQVRCLIGLEEYREAEVWGRKAVSVLPGSSRAHSALAYALARYGEEIEALQVSDQAMEVAAGDPHSYLWLERAVCLMACQRWTTAEACFSKVLELRVDADWRQRQAAEYLAFAKPQAGVSLLNEVVAARPERPYAWLLLGRGYRAMGDVVRSEKAFWQADQLCPGWDAVRLERARGLGWPGWALTLRRWIRRD